MEQEGEEGEQELEEGGGEHQQQEEERDERRHKRHRSDAAAAVPRLDVYAMAVAWWARENDVTDVISADVFDSGALAGRAFSFAFEGRWRTKSGGGGGGGGGGSDSSVFVTVAGVVERAGFAVRGITLRESPRGVPVRVRASGNALVPHSFNRLAAAAGFSRVDNKQRRCAATFVLPEIGERGETTLAALLAAARQRLGT